MNTLSTSPSVPAATGFSRGTQWWTLFLFMCGGGVVLIEPSPYEFAFFLALFVFMLGGMRLGAGAVVMAVLLMLYNIGGLFSLIPFLDDGDAVRFIGVSFYLAVTAIFFAALLQDDARWADARADLGARQRRDDRVGGGNSRLFQCGRARCDLHPA